MLYLEKPGLHPTWRETLGENSLKRGAEARRSRKCEAKRTKNTPRRKASLECRRSRKQVYYIIKKQISQKASKSSCIFRSLLTCLSSLPRIVIQLYKLGYTSIDETHSLYQMRLHYIVGEDIVYVTWAIWIKRLSDTNSYDQRYDFKGAKTVWMKLHAVDGIIDKLL